MKAKKLVEAAIAAGAPPQEFWENELEIGCESALQPATRKDFMNGWIAGRTGRQLSVIRQKLGITGEGSVRKRKTELSPQDPRLLPFVLIQEFARFKSHGAIFEWAERVLPDTALEQCRQSEVRYDTLALCFALYDQDPDQLPPILHLDRTYKSGFARMKLVQNFRKPEQPLEKGLTRTLVQTVLTEYDEIRDDGRAGEFKNLVPDENRVLVFVRRCERPDAIMQGTRVVHGHRREWIVLEFFDGAKRVNIASLTVDESLEIANRIGSAYHGRECHYDNEVAWIAAKQIEHYLEKLKHDKDSVLKWVELVVANTPLAGACGMRLTDAESNPIGKAVIHFEQRIGKILSPIDRIESIKVLFRDKRVSLQFEREDESKDAYVVRYSDHRLTPKERRLFEEHMREIHEIPVLSTEKRFEVKG